MQEFQRLLRPDRLTHVVDIGASALEDVAPYQPMLDAGLCRVTGFEPQPGMLAELNKRAGIYETYLPDVIGDGGEHTLYICAYPGWTSLFHPSASTLECFAFLKQNATVLRQEKASTRRLDDFDLSPDFLKMDIQGGELAALKSGAATLRSVVAVQLEVPFVNLYEGQPSFGEIDQELRRQGFVTHALINLKKWPISPLQFGDDPTRPFNQLLEADLVYVRDFTVPEVITNRQLKHLALISHTCYGSIDLAGRCVALLEKREALPKGSVMTYVEILRGLSAEAA